jgi:hypothetical protein
MAKLLIPSVSGYQARPEGFLYARATALYTHINFLLGGGAGDLSWANTGLTRAWGAANRHSRDHYIASIQEAKLNCNQS